VVNDHQQAMVGDLAIVVPIQRTQQGYGCIDLNQSFSTSGVNNVSILHGTLVVKSPFKDGTKGFW